MLVRNWIAPLVIAGVAGLWFLDPAPRVAGAGVTGTITGTVTFAGSAPSPEKLDVTIDTEVCEREPQFSEDLLVASENGGLKNVVVWLNDFPEQEANDSPTSESPTLDQNGCRFDPHVLIVRAGAPVTILNSDGILHNIHTRSSVNRPINKAQPGILKKVSARFKYPEIVAVECDAHDWMSAWIVVAGHAHYAITGEDGRYRLDNVPPGTYTLEFWHERLGSTSHQAVVVSEKEAHADVQFDAE